MDAPCHAYVGLGANLDDPAAALAEAVEALAATHGLGLDGLSARYRSEPVDASGPDFVNAVLRLRCRLAPLVLLDHLQALEAAAGRQRPFRNAPRTLDLDLLDVPGLVMAHPRLTLPHPRLGERLFVLLPLLELWPQAAWPGLGRARDLTAALAGQRIERLHADARWQALQVRAAGR